jgi:HK97 family phage major capsid protein
MNSTELRQRRASLWEQAKSLHALAEKENRELTAEERQQWDRINKEIDSLKETIDRVERIAAIDTEMSEIPAPVIKPEIRNIESLGEKFSNEPESPLPNDKEYKNAFGAYLRQGPVGMKPEQRAIIQPYFGAVNTRALGTGAAPSGGPLVPEEFYRQMLEAMQAYGGMRQARTTKISTASGADLPIPLVDDTYNKGAILAEGSNVNVLGVDPSFGSKTLGSFMYTSLQVRLSLQLLQDSAFNLESWLANALGRRIGRITNDHFTTGAGGGTEPEGILTAAPAGVTDASLDVDYADLIALEHSIDPAYRANGAQWMFHDTLLSLLKQIKAVEDGRPIWLPGLAVSAPDTILGYQYIINQSMPEAEAEAKAILFGDFSYYFIRDVQDVRVLRLEERYAEYLQVAFIAFLRTDGVFATPTAISGGSEQGANESSPVKYLQFGDESA